MSDTVLEPPRIDANGIPILPGYRKPFTSETAKLYTQKAQAVRREKRLARLAKIHRPGLIPSEAVEIAAIVSASLRQYRRCMAACVASTSGKEAAQWARAAKDAFECWQSLLGHNSKSHKSTKKPHLAHVAPMAKVQPISTVQSTSQVGQDASQVKVDGKELPKVDVSGDDCPFWDDCPF